MSNCDDLLVDFLVEDFKIEFKSRIEELEKMCLFILHNELRYLG